MRRRALYEIENSISAVYVHKVGIHGTILVTGVTCMPQV